jgi:uncharacterized protein (TIGR02611 family)
MSSEPADAPRHKLLERLVERREQHVRRGRLYRVMFAIAGGIVTLAGVAMLVLPGPAFVVIPIGLAMLAMEFAWAELWLEKALLQAYAAQEKASQASTAQKVMGGIATALAVAAFATAAVLWDIPLVPLL